MPRETIHPVARDPFEIQVGWDQHESMRLGVAGADGRSLVWLLYGNDDAELAKLGAVIFDLARAADGKSSREQLGRDVLNALDCLPTMGADDRILDRVAAETGSGYQAVFASLDRKTANELIRVLRRARNQAFGADE